MRIKKAPNGVKGVEVEEQRQFFTDSVGPAWMRINVVVIFDFSYFVLDLGCSFYIS